MGTAFLGCVEAAGSPAARALFAADETGYGRVFDVAQQAAWPREFGGRAVANAYFDEWVGREDDLDERPGTGSVPASRRGLGGARLRG